MDAVMYLKEKARMIGADKEHACNYHCEECPMNKGNSGTEAFCTDIERVYPEKAVEIVERWSKEHPRKTYLMDLLDKYPQAEIGANGIPLGICPYHLGYSKEPPTGGCGVVEECLECWHTPMEDDE